MVDVVTPRARTIILTDASTVAYSDALAGYDGTVGTPSPSPAPSFSVMPSIAGTPEVGQTLTAMDGVIMYATEVSRRWLLSSVLKSTAATWLATSAGELVLEVTAMGPGGSTTRTSAPIQVAEATPGTPAPTALFGPAGFNVGSSQLEYFGSGFPFLDRFKSSEWRAFKPALNPSDPDVNVPITYNADRYPVGIPATATKMSVLINVEGPLGPAGVAQRYVIETNNDFSFNIAGATAVTVDNDGTNGQPRRISFTANSPFPDRGYYVSLDVSAIPTAFVAGTHFVRMFRLDEEASLKAGEIFTPQFVARFKIVDVIRYMDWVGTNQDKVRSWADRPKLSWGSWTGSYGVPFEVMAALANKTGKHMHITIPVQIGTTTTAYNIYGRPSAITQNYGAEVEYVRNMATLLHGAVNSNILIGVEYGNENWNYQSFNQYYYMKLFNPQLLPGSEDYRNAWAMSGYRGTRLIGEFLKTINFADRFIPLLCSQAVNSDVTNGVLGGVDTALAEWANSSHANYDATLAARYASAGQLYTGGLGIAPYFNGGIDGTNTSSADKTKILGWANASDDSGILALIRQLDVGDQLAWGSANSIAGFNAAFAAQFALAQARQMPIFNYEFNFELPGANGNLWLPGTPEDTLTRKFYARTFEHSAFRALMLKALNVMKLAGIYYDDILAEFGDRRDTYGTLTTAYPAGTLTPRGMALQDFRTSPGPSIPLDVSISDPGMPPIGSSNVTTITTTGGVGRVRLTVTGIAPGRAFDGFRSIRGAYTTAGTYTINVTATDEIGATKTAARTFTVKAAGVGKRYFRLTTIGIASHPTNEPLSSGNGPPSLSEVTFKNSNGSIIPMTGVVASGDQFNTSETPQMMIDGDTSTFWTGLPNKTNISVFDFGAGNAQTPATIVMQDRADQTDRAPGDFLWEWSDDGSTWQQIYRTIITNGSTPGNAVFGNTQGGYNGAYVNHIFTATMVYP